MNEQTVQVQCLFSAEEVQQIIQQSFQLYLDRILADRGRSAV